MTEITPSSGVFARERRRRRETGPRIARALVVLIVSSLIFTAIWASKTALQEITRADGEIAIAGALVS